MTSTTSNFAEPHFGNIPIGCVVPSKTNPRKHFDTASLEELAESIRRHGIAQPILVRPLPATEDAIDPVEIVAGERRYRAAKMAGLLSIPAIVKNLTDVEALEIQIIENLQRKDVHEIEEAEGYQQLMDKHQYTADQLADKVAKSRSYIYGRLKLCALVPAAREAFFDGKLNASTALLIARIPVESLQKKATDEITDEHGNGHPMPYRRAVQHIQSRYMLELADARFNIQDAKLVKAAGACTTCPKRTGAEPELYPDVEDADVCTDPDCFATKRTTYSAKLIAAAEKNGLKVHNIQDAWAVARENDLVLHARFNDFDRPTPGHPGYDLVENFLPAELLPKPAAYAKQNNGDLVPMYNKTTMQIALEKAGLCETVDAYNARIAAGGEDGDDDETDQTQTPISPDTVKAELESKYRQQLYRTLREKILQQQDPLEALRHIAKFISAKWTHPTPLKSLYDFNTYSDTDCAQYFDRASSVEIVVFLLEIALGDDALTVQPYQVKNDNYDEVDNYQAMLELAESSGIDYASIRDEVMPAQPADDLQSETADATPLEVGDRVRIKDGLKGPDGKKRKCCGREGVIGEIIGGHYVVKTGTKAHESFAHLARGDLDKLPAESETESTAAPAKKTKASAKKELVAAWPFPTSAELAAQK